MSGPRRLVRETTAALRDRVYAVPSGTLLGSLRHLAAELGVGIVTMQQAARVLEHEGLLHVRRGPGGGYYGMRPDAGALERAIAAYLRSYPASRDEVLDMTSLLFTELAAAAAACPDDRFRTRLKVMLVRLDTGPDRLAFETEFQELLFAMVERPLFEVLTRVALSLAGDGPARAFAGPDGAALWTAGRKRIIAAILARDPALARFEADRSNRAVVLSGLGRGAVAEQGDDA